MNAMDEGSRTSSPGPPPSESDVSDIDALSQQMEHSLPSGSQKSIGASQHRDLTPDVPRPASRLASIVHSDVDALLYGAEDDPALASQDSNASHQSRVSRITDTRSDATGARDSSQAPRRGNQRPAPSNWHHSDSIYDSERYKFPLKRYWHPEGLLVCRDKHREFLYSQAKCMGVSANLEKPEAYGITWSFVFPFEGFGLPEQMIKAIYFFTMIESLSTHHNWNNCVVPTKNLKRNLTPNYNGKDIHGVLEGTCTEDAEPTPMRVCGSVDLNDLLQASENSSTGMVYKSMPLLRMNIGITGALYRADGREKRKLFGILYVHWLLNVDFMQLMLVSVSHCVVIVHPSPVRATDEVLADPQKTILAVPGVKTSNFENVNKARNTLFDTFISLLVNQAHDVTGGMSALTPLDFLENPTGNLGAHNLCNPLWEPFKMVKSLGKDATSVRIIGYPNIDWQGDPRVPAEDNDLNNYITFASGYTSHMVDWCSQIQTACRKFNNASPGNSSRRKRKQAAETGGESEEGGTEFELPVFYGLPVRLDTSPRFYGCITSYVPIFLDVRYLKVPDSRESYTCFQINFGGIPMILQCLFRAFLFHGRAGIDATRLDKIYLEDLDVKWNLGMLEERFYGAESKNSLHLASAGCNMKSYRDLITYIKSGVKDGSVSPYNAVQVLNRHFELCWGLYVAMVNGGSFMSDKLTQSLRILKKLYAMNSNNENPFFTTLFKFQSEIIPHTPGDFLVNPYDFAKRVILASMVNTNNAGQLLNSINLGTKLDLYISMVAYSMGSDNKSLSPMGRGIEIAPCNGSAREFLAGAKGVTVMKVDNPNGCGKDFSILMVNEDFSLMAELLKEGKFEIDVENDFSKVSILLRTCIQVVNGKVISTPDPSTNGVFSALTECRDLGDQLKILIMYVFPRGAKTGQISTTTMENPTSKIRQVVNRIKVTEMSLVMRCTNMPISSTVIQEQYMTLYAVVHCRPSGSTIYTPADAKGTKLGGGCVNRFECRSRRLSDKDAQRTVYVHAAAVIAAEHVGRMNQTMFPAEINPAVAAALDWTLNVMQMNCESMFHVACVGRRLNRLKRVYEARSAAMGLYAHTMNSLMQYEDYEEVIYKAALAFHCDPLPLSNCGDLLYTLIYRSLSWVPFVYSRCYAIETNVPVVPIDIMIKLFTLENGPPSHGSELRKWYDEVAAWLTQCVVQCRFCINPEGDSFSEYISNSGNVLGGVTENGVLRVAKEQNGWLDTDNQTVPRLLAEYAWSKYGQELAHTFALSEASLAVCVDEMLKTFEVRGGKLLGFDIGDVDRHAEYFGLSDQLTFKAKSFRNDKKPFAIQHVWPKDDTRDTKAAHSVGIGLHWPQLLLLTSLTGDSIGTNIHPQFISDLARTLTRLVLAQSPAGVTPGRYLEISSFNCYDCSLEPIDMGSCKERPEHFIRPQNDQLAVDGVLPDCPNFQNFAAEDILPVGPLCGWAERIGCQVWKVPAIANVLYNVRPSVCYLTYNQTSGAVGALEVSGAGVITMEYDDGSGAGDMSASFDLMTWQTELMDLGFVILPLITRSGACVATTDEGGVGCIVRCEEDGASFNISRQDKSYRVKVHVDTVQVMPPLVVMEKLLPIGTLCYLKMECQSAGPLVRRLSMPLSSDDRLSRVLRIRLSTPNVRHPIDGKLYVVFATRRGVVVVGETMAVDPWEITTDKGRRLEIEHLTP